MLILKHKQQNLSVAPQEAKYASASQPSTYDDQKQKGGRDKNPLPEFTKCSEGICQVTWKPLRRTA